MPRLFFISSRRENAMAQYARIVQVVIKGRIHNQETNNVLHFGTNTVNPAYLQLLLDIIDCLRVNRAMFADAFTVEKLTARELFPVPLDELESTPNPALVGSGLPALPTFNAVLISLSTGLGGRSNRGRLFMPGVVANDTALSKITATGLPKWQAFVTCMIGKFVGAEADVDSKPFNWGVLSRKKSGVNYATADVAFSRIKTAQVKDVIATMHSRKLGVGS
jgi:hypothetical protein